MMEANPIDTPIKNVLENMGISNLESQRTAADYLVAQGVISGRKRVNIDAAKVPRVEEYLREGFVWHCPNGECREEARADGGSLLAVESSHCPYCGGSNDKRALRHMSEALESHVLSRVLVVGGTEKKRREIQAKSGGLPVAWRFVDGTTAKDDRYYRNDRDWADVIVLWSGTPLDHRVSYHFIDHRDRRIMTARSRGITGVCNAVLRHLQGHSNGTKG